MIDALHDLMRKSVPVYAPDKPAGIAIKIDEAELIIRMIEAATGDKRPPGFTLERVIGTIDRETFRQCQRQARAVIQYIAELAGAIELVAEGEVT